MGKIKLQVKYKAKHYWKQITPGIVKDAQGKPSKKFARRRLLCGQGTERLNGEVVAHGDIIEVDDIAEVGSAIDKFIVLNPQDVQRMTDSKEGAEEVVRKKKGLKKVEREDGEGWDVINRGTGLKVNDEPLTKKDASSMVKDSKKDD
jgi:hypothetical protein